MDGLADGQINERMHGRTDEWTDGDEGTDGQGTAGRTERTKSINRSGNQAFEWAIE